MPIPAGGTGFRDINLGVGTVYGDGFTASTPTARTITIGAPTGRAITVSPPESETP